MPNILSFYAHVWGSMWTDKLSICISSFPTNITDRKKQYDDVMMSAMASQITSLTIVYSIVYSSADQRKRQNSMSLAFVWGIHRGLVTSPHKGQVTWKMFPFDGVIMIKKKINKKDKNFSNTLSTC